MTLMDSTELGVRNLIVGLGQTNAWKWWPDMIILGLRLVTAGKDYQTQKNKTAKLLGRFPLFCKSSWDKFSYNVRKGGS